MFLSIRKPSSPESNCCSFLPASWWRQPFNKAMFVSPDISFSIILRFAILAGLILYSFAVSLSWVSNKSAMISWSALSRFGFTVEGNSFSLNASAFWIQSKIILPEFSITAFLIFAMVSSCVMFFGSSCAAASRISSARIQRRGRSFFYRYFFTPFRNVFCRSELSRT